MEKFNQNAVQYSTLDSMEQLKIVQTFTNKYEF